MLGALRGHLCDSTAFLFLLVHVSAFVRVDVFIIG